MTASATRNRTVSRLRRYRVRGSTVVASTAGEGAGSGSASLISTNAPARWAGSGSGIGSGEPHAHRRAAALVRHRFGVKTLPTPVSSRDRSGSSLRMALTRTTVSFGVGPAGLVMTATPHDDRGGVDRLIEASPGTRRA